MADTKERLRREALAELIGNLLPGATLLEVEPMSPDATRATTASKRAGYGEPVRLSVRAADGRAQCLVFHTDLVGEFGHDRRADRAADALLSYDTFGAIPAHVRPLDVGAIERGGVLRSLRDAGEFYLLSEYAEGVSYAEHLRGVGQRRLATEGDVALAQKLAELLSEIHTPQEPNQAIYRRAVRDLIGHGEGIFGIIDGYADNVPAAPASRLQAIEHRCVHHRWRLRARADRLVRTHGDFHPFNVVIGERGQIALLDTSRGSVGDPADDVMAMAINFIFFALEAPGSWQAGHGRLWRAFLQRYFERRPDNGLLSAAPPFFAWRALVVCNPVFYPNTSVETRHALLTLAERWLDIGHVERDDAEALFL